MAKTVMAMLLGVAVNDGRIASLDDLASRYVPALKDSGYGETRLRDLLHMGSGIAFSEDYLGQDDNTKLNVALRRSDSPGMAALLAQYNAREAPAGTRFHYASSESMVLGLVLRSATGMTLADYASEKLWRRIGAEADASWGTDPKGIETGSCCFNARLRDYARLALMLAHDGRGVIPEGWMREATTAPPESPFAPRRATPFYGYGYQVWLLPGPRRAFALLGVHGQTIFVDPPSKLVLVHTAVRLKASQDPQARELVSLWSALVRDYGQR
jgi:CubicO group peptidase (beta-lactamase class C family)